MQIEEGAECVLTQPPFDMAAFERWVADAERRGLLHSASPRVTQPGLLPALSPFADLAASQHVQVLHAGGASSLLAERQPAGFVRLLVGAPIITSATNLAFWMSLSGCLGRWAVLGELLESIESTHRTCHSGTTC